MNVLNIFVNQKTAILFKNLLVTLTGFLFTKSLGFAVNIC